MFISAAIYKPLYDTTIEKYAITDRCVRLEVIIKTLFKIISAVIAQKRCLLTEERRTTFAINTNLLGLHINKYEVSLSNTFQYEIFIKSRACCYVLCMLIDFMKE